MLPGYSVASMLLQWIYRWNYEPIVETRLLLFWDLDLAPNDQDFDLAKLIFFSSDFKSERSRFVRIYFRFVNFSQGRKYVNTLCTYTIWLFTTFAQINAGNNHQILCIKIYFSVVVSDLPFLTKKWNE